MIRAQCQCGKKYKVSDSHAGKSATCSHCKERFKIPPLGDDILLLDSEPTSESSSTSSSSRELQKKSAEGVANPQANPAPLTNQIQPPIQGTHQNSDAVTLSQPSSQNLIDESIPVSDSIVPVVDPTSKLQQGSTSPHESASPPIETGQQRRREIPVDHFDFSRWTIRNSNGQSFGPMSRKDLNQCYTSGQLTPNCMLLKEGKRNWVPAHQVFEDLAQTAPADALQSQSASPTPPLNAQENSSQENSGQEIPSQENPSQEAILVEVVAEEADDDSAPIAEIVESIAEPSEEPAATWDDFNFSESGNVSSGPSTSSAPLANEPKPSIDHTPSNSQLAPYQKLLSATGKRKSLANMGIKGELKKLPGTELISSEFYNVGQAPTFLQQLKRNSIVGESKVQDIQVDKFQLFHFRDTLGEFALCANYDNGIPSPHQFVAVLSGRLPASVALWSQGNQCQWILSGGGDPAILNLLELYPAIPQNCVWERQLELGPVTAAYQISWTIQALPIDDERFLLVGQSIPKQKMMGFSFEVAWFSELRTQFSQIVRQQNAAKTGTQELIDPGVWYSCCVEVFGWIDPANHQQSQ